MKILIAILSCVKFSQDGSNQAARNTYLQEVKKYPAIDYKFFIGDGTPVEDGLEMSRSFCNHELLDENRVTLGINPYVPREDEVILHVPDDYLYLSWKLKEALRWGMDHGYDYIFNAACDTYIDIQRLLNSGFERQDYLGRSHGAFAIGGSGYWLSRKAAQCVLDSPIYDWASDRWAGKVLHDCGVVLQSDKHYGASPEQTFCCAPEHRDPIYPTSENSQITAHLAEAPGHYHHSMMYKAHEIRGKNGLNQRFNNDGSEKLRLATSEALCDIPSQVRVPGNKVDTCSGHIGESQKEPVKPRFQRRGLRSR